MIWIVIGGLVAVLLGLGALIAYLIHRNQSTEDTQPVEQEGWEDGAGVTAELYVSHHHNDTIAFWRVAEDWMPEIGRRALVAAGAVA